MEPQVVVSVDRIIDTIWGDDAPARAEVSVRGYVSNLRKALAGAIDGRDARSSSATAATCSTWRRRHRPAPLRGGRRRGRDHLRAGRLPEARARLAEALDLSAERPFGALADGLHLDGVIAGIDQRRGEAAEALTEVRLTLGEHDTIGPDLMAMVAAYPYREKLRVQLATARYRSGDQVAALRTIADARRTLADDIGLEPGPELQAVEAAILAHDPSLAWTPPTEPARAPTNAGRREPPWTRRSSVGSRSWHSSPRLCSGCPRAVPWWSPVRRASARPRCCATWSTGPSTRA